MPKNKLATLANLLGVAQALQLYSEHPRALELAQKLISIRCSIKDLSGGDIEPAASCQEDEQIAKERAAGLKGEEGERGRTGQLVTHPGLWKARLN